MRKAFAYLRVSGKGQVRGDGFARQSEAVRDYAKAHGIRIIRTFREAGVSGTKELENRPALSGMMEAPRKLKTRVGELALSHGGDESPSARVISWDHYRMRLIVLAALTTGMRLGEIFALCWSDLDYGQGLIAVRSHLKNGKTRYVPMSTELAEEFRRFPQVFGEERIFPPKPGAKSGRQRVDRSFKSALKTAGTENFRSTTCVTLSRLGT